MSLAAFAKQRNLRTLAFFGILGLLSACNYQNTTTTEPVHEADTLVRSDTTRNIQDFGLTLPVLDALFLEEDFQETLTSQLQLTSEQISKLKVAASASVANLSEDGTNYLGSARAAKQQSEEQIREILGPDKADQLFRLVSQRYASGDIDGLFPTTPNAVPTDTRIVVNAPAFRMDVFQEGKLLKSYRIGIGYPEFPLPTGMRRAESIIFNPTWTPPDEPWVKGKFQPGKKVAAGSELNPLGLIKIPIGSPSLIHGGKPATKLGDFASHGCVGLTNDQVQDLATVLGQLSGTPITAERIQDLEKQKKKTEAVKLGQPVLVELRYETIVAENGKLYIHRDVYERGTNTMKDAIRVLNVYGVQYESLSAQEKAAVTNALSEMNLDSQGNAIAENVSSKDTTSGAQVAVDSKNGVAASKQEGAKKGKVTRSVEGQKELVIPIAALQGKGYPAAANLNTGSSSTRFRN
ncbi:L,D-transpeptidase [Daejeonella sp.]|uniref:L,D-transpeptidase n=1 Tax=Daejeonella sp. TaxID=2805397 RepID=UPI0030C45A5F